MDNLIILNLALGSVMVPLLGIIAYRFGVVDLSGCIASIFIGLSVFWLEGWTWFIQILYFITIASIFTKFKYGVKEAVGAAQEKGGARTWRNVLANGGIAALSTILYWISQDPIWYLCFIGSISSMTADTLATEVGLTSKNPPRFIIDPGVIVPPGTSGGVTGLGLFAGFSAAVASGLLGFLSAPSLGLSLQGVLLIASLSGFIGMNIDSLLGATLQGLYRCKLCDKVTEKRVHCGQPTFLQKGIPMVGNDAVNFFSSLLGGFSAILLYLAL